MTVKAYCDYYFEENGLPIAIRQVNSESTSLHKHDLTEVEHVHDFSELIVVSKGSGIQSINGVDYKLIAGDVFLIAGETQHYFKERKNLSISNVIFDPTRLPLPLEWLNKIPGYHALFTLEPQYRERHNFSSHLRLNKVCLRQTKATIDELKKETLEKSPGFEVRCFSLLLDIIIFVSRQYSLNINTSSQGLLQMAEVIAALETDFTKQWKLQELADIACMSESNLLIVFREATGSSPINYLLRMRVQHAMKLLKRTNISITRIAHQVGFNDSNYFSRCFKRQTGITPRTYRNS
jgi:AraC-like DNA-binding protein